MRFHLAWVLLSILGSLEAWGFPGAYFSKSGSKLVASTAQVVVVRDGEKTVLTLGGDYKGEPTSFAIVVPIPAFLEADQIHVGDSAPLERIDAFTSPRLVEHFDENPCAVTFRRRGAPLSAVSGRSSGEKRRTKILGVTIDDMDAVGEYQISVISATDPRALRNWLSRGGYRVTDAEGAVLDSYVQQGFRFFVARTNAEGGTSAGVSLRPIQVAFNSPKLILPIRIGALNAQGSQELTLYTLSRKGRVEPANYRMVPVSEGFDIPVFVKTDFWTIYRAIFQKQARAAGPKMAFVEYEGNVAQCKSCAAEPLTNEELRALGVYWLDGKNGGAAARQGTQLARYHLIYSPDLNLEDLVFQETTNRSNYQIQYSVKNSWAGDASSCPEAKRYRDSLQTRNDREAQSLANLTGWSLQDIRSRMAPPSPSEDPSKKWWKGLWKEGQ